MRDVRIVDGEVVTADGYGQRSAECTTARVSATGCSAGCTTGFDRGLAIAGLAFLAAHHEREGARALDAVGSRLTDTERRRCKEVAAHHTEQLHQVGEQIALLGGRNAYPRKVPAAARAARTGTSCGYNNSSFLSAVREAETECHAEEREA